MCKQNLKLVVNNTPVVQKQPFKQPVIVTEDEMTKLRNGFEEWLECQGQ